MSTNIPADMDDYIVRTLGHSDFAPYVLDGQTAEVAGDEDDWHDVLVIEFRPAPLMPRIIKFTRYPNGVLEHYDPLKEV